MNPKEDPMPIILDDIDSIAAQKPRPNTPHFFSQYLTGRGKSTGLINQAVKPGRYRTGQNAASVNPLDCDHKGKSGNGSVTVRTIPMAPLTVRSASLTDGGTLSLQVPDLDECLHVTQHATALDFDVYLDLSPQSSILTEDGSGDSIVRRLDVLYRMDVFVLPQGQSHADVPLLHAAPAVHTPTLHTAQPNAPRALVPFAVTGFSFAPLDDAEALIRSASSSYAPGGNGVFVDAADLATFTDGYDLYERICRQADAWNSPEIGRAVGEHVRALFQKGTPDDQALNRLAFQLRYLEGYNVPLAAYRQIYDDIRAACPSDIAETLAKQNLNLLMNGTLADLDAVKPQLTAVPAPNQAQALKAIPMRYSSQQRAAIATAEPLTLATAGAGSGKSSVILARIDYLVACGVDPREITVLSFTNAAADNILAKNPQVSSMTIARMVLDIYKLNHPTHQISTVDTIGNALDIFCPNDDLALALRRLLVKVDKNEAGSTTALNAFVEKHFDRVLALLDKIEQTCLELQIIIAYQQIDQMVEPPHLAGKFLIVDEVQDNSIFEFIYLLRYVIKHRQNMFIVGDASQTLYEFRSANPKALNALEGSGVFATCKLTTNYRSNQEILDFANVHLADIEANSLSKIRLEANSLALPTEASFRERVRLEYRTYPSQTGFKQDIPALTQNVVKPYVDACLARGEKVAFLAFSKLEVNALEKSLRELYPGREVANITSKRRRPTTVFSQFVKLSWNQVRQVRPGDAALVVANSITGNVVQYAGRWAAGNETAIRKMVSDWWLAGNVAINGWVALHNAGQLSADAFFDRLMHNILDYEIEQNGIKQNILNLQNRQRKEVAGRGSADLIVSTIHGAKGLEFDNVVILHFYESQMAEDEKRMYYVALTRAMKSELVLSHGSQKFPRIVSDYDLIAQALRRRDGMATLRRQGVDVDALDEDELKAALEAVAAVQTADKAREPVPA